MSKQLTVKLAGIGYTTVALAKTALASVPSSLQEGVSSSQPTGAQSDLFGSSGIFTTIANTLIFLVGAIAVIMLIIGGLRYVLSAGDQGAVTSAKNTIMYAIIGIIVAILAFAAVNFVLQQFSR